MKFVDPDPAYPLPVLVLAWLPLRHTCSLHHRGLPVPIDDLICRKWPLFFWIIFLNRGMLI